MLSIRPEHWGHTKVQIMTDAEVRSVADTVLSRLLGPYGFTKALVRSGQDHDGDPALFIRAHFKPGSEPFPGKVANTALAALSDALIAQGEMRFPYLTHYFLDGDVPEDVPIERLGLP